MPTREYPLHKGAKTALTVTAALCILLCVSAPFGIYILIRKGRGKLTVSERGIEAAALGTTRIDFADVARLGVCHVPIAARGIGGALARQKVGGDHAVNVCVISRDGRSARSLPRCSRTTKKPWARSATAAECPSSS